MEGLLVILLGAFLVFISIWWLIHVTYNYQKTQYNQQHYNVVTITTQYTVCNVIRVEGLFKFIIGLSLAIAAFEQTSKSPFLRESEIGTICLFLASCGLQDMLAGFLNTNVFGNFDSLLTVILFSILSVFFLGYSTVTPYPHSTLYSLSLLTSFSICVCLLLEKKCSKEVVFGMMRCYLVFLLGTWMIEANFLISDSNFPLDSQDMSLKLAIYFSWHCGLDFVIVLCIWNLVYKFSAKNHCYCLSAGLADDSAFDVVYLENRVHFDMNILGRLEEGSDIES